MKSYESYKARWLEHERREDEANESRRQDACRVAVKLAKTLSESYTVKKIILFGSCIQAHEFTEKSDIDIAVDQLPKKHFFPALARLNELSPYPVDLKPLDDVRDSMKRRIEKGIILYEAR